jgi:hypothetical protein
MAHNFSRNAMRIRDKKYGDNLGRKAFMSPVHRGKSSAKNKKVLLYRRVPHSFSGIDQTIPRIDFWVALHDDGLWLFMLRIFSYLWLFYHRIFVCLSRREKVRNDNRLVSFFVKNAPNDNRYYCDGRHLAIIVSAFLHT